MFRTPGLNNPFGGGGVSVISRVIADDAERKGIPARRRRKHGGCDMNGKEVLELDFIICPECNAKTEAQDWLESEVECEDCGSHGALRCPSCGEDFDHVWGYDKLINRTKLG